MGTNFMNSQRTVQHQMYEYIAVRISSEQERVLEQKMKKKLSITLNRTVYNIIYAYQLILLYCCISRL